MASLVKPFAMAEVVARVKAVLRRENRPLQDVFVYEDLEINRVSHEVRRGAARLS